MTCLVARFVVQPLAGITGSLPALLLGVGLVGLPAIAPTVAQAQQPAELPEGAVATVNGRPVRAASVDSVEAQLQGTQNPASREQIIEELVNLEVLAQAAEQDKLAERDDVAAALALQYAQTMANAYLGELSESIEPSEQELRAEYERQSAEINESEYLASHILLENETDALEIIQAIEAGGDFAQLARDRSIDPSADNGGDLGWFQATTMVPEFAAAIQTMEPGSTSFAPVETEFGWHIIQLRDKRAAAKPDYESVKPGLRQILVRTELASRVEALREQADIVLP